MSALAEVREGRAVEYIVSAVRRASGSFDTRSIDRLKREASSIFGLSYVLPNSKILSAFSEEERRRYSHLFTKKPVRSASGIVVISVMTKPHPCPIPAPCVYCPGGVPHDSPQSYTGLEPAAARGREQNYDPYRQVRVRIEHLRAMGHTVSKAELIIMGGTFLSTPREYQEWFMKRCLDAMSEEECSALEEAIAKNEKARIRNVGITVETRPDYCKEPHVDLMLRYGVTKVEIGVQNLDDEIYALVKRGHGVKEVIEAFRIAKDAGLKVVAHMMPGLPGSSFEKDLRTFDLLFNSPEFRPDMLKIYPTLVVESAELYKWYLEKRYVPPTEDEMIELVSRILEMVPPWVRVMRVQRDIPSSFIVAGVKKGNIRELAMRRLKERGGRCREIRCREIGLLQLKTKERLDPEEIRLFETTYAASEGEERFLSFENEEQSALVGFLRLRVPSERAHRPEVKNAAIVRELHVYGKALPLHARDRTSWQHRGYGVRLLGEAERIAREEYSVRKLLVMSAIGTREYYRRLGYELEGPYMSKAL